MCLKTGGLLQLQSSPGASILRGRITQDNKMLYLDLEAAHGEGQAKEDHLS